MSDQHIPIPEGWLDPQFRGGGGLDPGAPPNPLMMPPEAPALPAKRRPAGVAGVVQRAGEMATPIPAPRMGTGELPLATPRAGRGSYGKPLGSGTDAPVIHASDAWFDGLGSSAPRPGMMFQDEWSPDDEVDWPEEEPPLPRVTEPLFPPPPPFTEPTVPFGPPEVPDRPFGPGMKSPAGTMPPPHTWFPVSPYGPPDKRSTEVGGPTMSRLPQIGEELRGFLGMLYGKSLYFFMKNSINIFNRNVKRFFELWRQSRGSSEAKTHLNDAHDCLANAKEDIKTAAATARLGQQMLLEGRLADMPAGSDIMRSLDSARSQLRAKDRALDLAEAALVKK